MIITINNTANSPSESRNVEIDQSTWNSITYVWNHVDALISAVDDTPETAVLLEHLHALRGASRTPVAEPVNLKPRALSFGARLRRARMAKGWSANELARRLSFKSGSAMIILAEQDRRRLTLENVAKCATLLNVDPCSWIWSELARRYPTAYEALRSSRLLHAGWHIGGEAQEYETPAACPGADQK